MCAKNGNLNLVIIYILAKLNMWLAFDSHNLGLGMALEGGSLLHKFGCARLICMLNVGCVLLPFACRLALKSGEQRQ